MVQCYSVWSGTLGFSVLAIFRLVFRFLHWKTLVFRFRCLLRFPVFLFFSIWFFEFWWPMWFLVFPLSRKVKDRPAWAPKVVFVVVLHYQLPSQVTFFALTSMSFRDLPLVEYDRRSLKKLFSAEADFLLLFYWFGINFSLRSCTAGSYVVTKGKSLSLLFCFCFSANCLESKWTSDNDLSISCLGYLRASRHCLTFARHSSIVFFFLRVCSKQSYCFASNETSFYPQRVS